jgi:putative endonuclease
VSGLLSFPLAGLDPATHVFAAGLEQTRYVSAMGGWVYIMTNRPNGTLYVGSTSDLPRRAWEHREGAVDGFTREYGLKDLVFFEWHDDIRSARQREKNIKH